MYVVATYPPPQKGLPAYLPPKPPLPPAVSQARLALGCCGGRLRSNRRRGTLRVYSALKKHSHHRNRAEVGPIDMVSIGIITELIMLSSSNNHEYIQFQCIMVVILMIQRMTNVINMMTVSDYEQNIKKSYCLFILYRKISYAISNIISNF